MTQKEAKSGKASLKVVESPQKRLTFHRLLPDPRVDTRSRWAKSRPELRNLTEAQSVMKLMTSDAFEQTVQPLLDRAEVERAERQRRKREFLYTVTEVERAMVFKAITGINLMKELRDKLAGDDPELRETLGYSRPRNAERNMRRMDGVPSEATLCRHRQLFDARERADAYVRFFELARDQHLIEFPVEMLDEIRLLGMDGSKIEIEGQCPIYKKKTGEIVNAKKVTCWDGGYVGSGSSRDHSGHGFNKMTITTASTLPLVFEVTPLNISEYRVAEHLVDRLGSDVFSKLKERRLSVLTADGIFDGRSLRARIRSNGMIENIHGASHADTPKVEARVARLRKERIKIKDATNKDAKNWFSNGLFELVCKCGKGNVRPGYDFKQNGETIARVEGNCDTCGRITITSSRWRLAKNPKQFMRVNPENPKERPHLAFGNPLTYDSPVSKVYGRQRFGRNEGLNSVMATRMGLTTGKRRYTTIQHARADVAVSYGLAHLLTMMQRRAEAAVRSAPPLAA